MTGEKLDPKWENMILNTLQPEEAVEVSYQEAVRSAEAGANEDSPPLTGIRMRVRTALSRGPSLQSADLRP